MRMFASLVPPREVLDEIETLVRSVMPAGVPTRSGAASGRTAGAHVAPRRRLIPRRPVAVVEDLGPVEHDELVAMPAELMHIPIAYFGTLTLHDSVQLAEALRTAVAGFARPTLHLSGGTALEWPEDRSVWAKLDGDLDGLLALAKGVPRAVQPLGLFVDRRQFRPWLPVGTITDATTAPYLEDLVAALDRFRGATWAQGSISLMKTSPDDGATGPFEEVERLPLAAG